MNTSTVKMLNGLGFLGICGVLIGAQTIQYLYGDLPCPLCLMQRVGMLGIAFGLLLNVYYQPRPSHYALSIFSALVTGTIAMRQILLHIVPNTGVYGLDIWGMHLYTWSFLISVLSILMITILLGFSKQYEQLPKIIKMKPTILSRVMFFLLMALALINVITTFKICGFGVCPSDPTQYIW